MDERTKEGGRFDERAALEELERFRQDIERYRARRKAVGEEFDEFIRSFKSPEEIFPSELAQPDGRVTSPGAPHPATSDSSVVHREIQPSPPRPLAAPAPPRPAPQSISPVAPPPPRPAPQPSSPRAPATPRPAPQPNSPVAAPARPTPQTAVPAAAAPWEPVAPATPGPASPVDQPSKRPRTVLGGALVLLALVAVATWSLRSGGPDPGVSEPATVDPAAPAPAATPPPAAAPSPAGTELTTIRRVWVRVIADGERVVERELPADARVPLKAEKTIVIRTGDAGAVRLSIAGQDQGILGRDGEVVTRTFTVGEAERR